VNELTVHPDVYATSTGAGLVDLLHRAWTLGPAPRRGALHIVSGFGNYNGGVRFFELFRRHVANGGEIFAIFAGSPQARLTSRQLVEELLDCGVHVTVVNRKRLLHAKMYGASGEDGQRLVVTSGNFTGPGMTQNVEVALALDEESTSAMGFSWDQLESRLRSQLWDYYYPSAADAGSPAWQMLYDEVGSPAPIDESALASLVLILGHADTARINAAPGTEAAKGSQYFWLSKDCYGFFPALTIRNTRGVKATYSCVIALDYLGLGQRIDARVTFEADNNLDFRLGTGPLRRTGLAAAGDIAVLSRRSEREYDLRIVRQQSPVFAQLAPHATHFIGHAGKKYGYVPNSVVDALLAQASTAGIPARR
jgi:hypothetical protein